MGPHGVTAPAAPAREAVQEAAPISGHSGLLPLPSPPGSEPVLQSTNGRTHEVAASEQGPPAAAAPSKPASRGVWGFFGRGGGAAKDQTPSAQGLGEQTNAPSGGALDQTNALSGRAVDQTVGTSAAGPTGSGGTSSQPAGAVASSSAYSSLADAYASAATSKPPPAASSYAALSDSYVGPPKSSSSGAPTPLAVAAQAPALSHPTHTPPSSAPAKASSASAYSSLADGYHATPPSNPPSSAPAGDPAPSKAPSSVASAYSSLADAYSLPPAPRGAPQAPEPHEVAPHPSTAQERDGKQSALHPAPITRPSSAYSALSESYATDRGSGVEGDRGTLPTLQQQQQPLRPASWLAPHSTGTGMPSRGSSASLAASDSSSTVRVGGGGPQQQQQQALSRQTHAQNGSLSRVPSSSSLDTGRHPTSECLLLWMSMSFFSLFCSCFVVAAAVLSLSNLSERFET